jgi:ADP-heptose:LPS heptosyltransferase
LLGRPWRIASWRRRLREVGAELAIDASPFHSASFLNGLITWGSGAPRRLGYDREGARDFLNLLTPPPREVAHESVLLHDLLRSLRSDLPPAPRLRVEVPRRSRALAARACRRLGIEGDALVVGLHPGGRRQKRWPVERFETVAGRLAERGVTVVVFSGAAERPLLDAMSPPGPRRVYAPPTDVSGLGAYLCGLDAFISGDSGPMHLAAALGVPCVSIFRVNDHARYGPLGAEHRILYRPDGDVEPDAVVAAVLKVLEAGRDQSVR